MRRLLRGVCVVTLLLLASESAITQTQSTDNTRDSAAPKAGGPLGTRGAYRVGGGVSAPRVIWNPDPEYSEEARREGISGTCVLWLVVSPEGLPRDIRVARVLGHGLDEKAIEAVKQWRFEPAHKDGKPVAVMINVEVTFRMYENERIAELDQRADAGDANAELELSDAYFNGKDVSKDEEKGYRLLLRAANQGLPKAQFQMGEYTAGQGNRPDDYIVAYMWYALAEHNGYKQSKKKLKELAAGMSAENIAEARARAQNWHNLPGGTSPQ
ncbi:MAG: TonB family protein [Terriglobales bacterium]